MKQDKLTQILERRGEYLMRHTRQLIANSDCLAHEDADDIYQLSAIKMWVKYWGPNATLEYTEGSESEDLALFKKVLRNTKIDLERQRRKEKYFVSICYDSGEEHNAIHERLSLRNNLTAEEGFEAIQEAINEICNTPKRQKVMDVLLGNLEQDELSISKNNFSVTSSLLYKQFKNRFKEVCEDTCSE